MKNKLLFILLASMTLIYGCCTKKYCIGADDLNEISFENFAKEDLDTVIVKRFHRNTNFVTALDSSITITENFSNEPDYQTIYLTEHLLVDFDYKVILVSTGQVYNISEFVVKKRRCNTGPFCNDHFNALESYQVNGQTRSVGALLISN